MTGAQKNRFSRKRSSNRSAFASFFGRMLDSRPDDEIWQGRRCHQRSVTASAIARRYALICATRGRGVPTGNEQVVLHVQSERAVVIDGRAQRTLRVRKPLFDVDLDGIRRDADFASHADRASSHASAAAPTTARPLRARRAREMNRQSRRSPSAMELLGRATGRPLAARAAPRQ